MRAPAAIAIVMFGCSGSAAPPPSLAPAPAATGTAPAAERAAAEPAIAGPTLSEAAGRAVLADKFRRAGWRIVYDVPVSREGAELTVDGYDPEHQIGFEYVDPGERGSDLVDAERTTLAGTILIVDAADADTVARLADAFLAAQLPASRADSD